MREDQQDPGQRANAERRADQAEHPPRELETEPQPARRRCSTDRLIWPVCSSASAISFAAAASERDT